MRKALSIEKVRVVGLLLMTALGLGWILTGCAVYGTPYGSGSEKVAVCHKNKKTLIISQSAVDAHLGHGDTLGSCQ